MTPAKGYYCLIQYCPDQARLEAATIGVLLFCPERGFLRATTTRDNRRIRRFFGRDGHDWSRINSFKAAIEERLEVEKSDIQSLADLETFVSLRANQFQLTPPRAIRVGDPEKDLRKLFEEVVGGLERKQGGRSLQRYVGDRLFKAGLRNKVRTNVEVVVPVFNRPVTLPYGYQNGRFNLIQPVGFQASSPAQVEKTASRYALEGKSLWDNPDPTLGPMKLVIVGKFPQQHPQTRDDVRRVLDLVDSHVDLIPTGELDCLIEEIRTTGKDISPDSAGAAVR